MEVGSGGLLMRPMNAYFCRHTLHGFLINGVTMETTVLNRHQSFFRNRNEGITNLCGQNSNEKIHCVSFEVRRLSK